MDAQPWRTCTIDPWNFHAAPVSPRQNGQRVSRHATDTRSELGARFDRVLAVYSNAVLALRARVAWAHDWVSDPSLTPLFQALPGASFIVNGALLPQNSALASAGGELRLANGITLLAKFDGEFASHSSTYGGTGTFRYRW